MRVNPALVLSIFLAYGESLLLGAKLPLEELSDSIVNLYQVLGIPSLLLYDFH